MVETNTNVRIIKLNFIKYYHQFKPNSKVPQNTAKNKTKIR